MFTTLKDNCADFCGAVYLFVWVVLFGLGFLFCFLLFFLCIKLGDSWAHPHRTSLPFQSRTAAPQLCRVPTGDSDRTQNKGHGRKWKVGLCNSCVSCLMRQLIHMCRASWATSGSFWSPFCEILQAPWRLHGIGAGGFSANCQTVPFVLSRLGW